MRPLVTCLTTLALLSAVSSQNFNPQPQLGDYAPVGGDYESRLDVSRPDYDYFGGDSSYYASPYGPGVGINPLASFPNSPRRDDYAPFNEEYNPPRDFAVTPDVIPNYELQSNKYTPGFNPGLIPNRPVLSDTPKSLFPPSQFENYDPTFTAPPLQGGYSPLYKPPLTLPVSASPNIIREEDDGKYISETKTSSTNLTLEPEPSLVNPTLDLGYKQNVVPTTIINGKAYETNFPQYYPETDFPEQPYTPNLRQLFNPYAAERTIPSVNLTTELTGDPSQNLGKTQDYPDLFSNDPKQILGNTPLSPHRTPLYPPAPSPDIPVITLSGSPRNLGGPSLSINSESISSPNFGGYASSGFQPPGDLPPLPNLSYEAPGREILA